ncbi:MAG: VOC family protein [Myxococcota bacterium]
MPTTMNPYLNFDGNTEEAMKFYADVLGGKLDLMRFSDGGMPHPPEAKNRVMHATLMTDSITLMASDTQPGQPVVKGNQVHISLNFSDKNEQTRVWERLSAGANVTMPLGDQFWGRFGMLTDRYGIQWMLNHQAPKK